MFKTEIKSSIFSNHSGIKLKVNNKKKIGNFTIMWKLSSIVLKKMRKMETQHSKICKIQ